ncbi:MAG: hypothetical protein ACRENP_26610 [Longimicrobiales bacterium]
MNPKCLAVLVLALLACGDRSRAPNNSQTTNVNAMVDSVLPRLQVIAGLTKRADIHMQMQSRDSLRKYVEARMTEELPAAELEGIRATYVTLGLLPPELDLRALLLDLYTEQVVGYYDPKTKKLFVVEDAPREMLRPTVVHELVHALQDQHTDLDALISRQRGNDRQTAAQAAIEGHATLVMFALLAEEQAGAPLDPRSLPDIGSTIRPSLEQQNEQFPVFKSAPRILRETLLFPYVAGAGFVQKLWVRPLETGFGDPYPAPIGERLPHSTEQIMHPDSRFMVRRDDPTELKFDSRGNDHVVRENSLGELETSIWLSEHLGAEAASLAQGWDGDRYRLMRVGADSAHALVWYSVWDTEASANTFADAARRVAQKRGRAFRIERFLLGQQPSVRFIDANAGVDLSRLTVPTVSIAKSPD